MWQFEHLVLEEARKLRRRYLLLAADFRDTGDEFRAHLAIERADLLEQWIEHLEVQSWADQDDSD